MEKRKRKIIHNKRGKERKDLLRKAGVRKEIRFGEEARE